MENNVLTNEKKQEIQALQAQFVGLEQNEWGGNQETAQQRGLRFESLIQDLFEVHGLLLRRSYRTQDGQSEQIDGAAQFLSRHALLESKWVESGLAASELFAFLGKVEGKFVGTMGIFISRVELSKNFLGALRFGRRQSVMVLHGADIPRLFDPDFPLEEYLEAHLSHIAIDNACHYSADRFLEERKVDSAADAEVPVAGEVANPNQAVVTEKFKECISKQAAKNLVREYAEKFTPEQRLLAAVRLVKNFKTVAAAKSAMKNSWRGENLHRLLQEVISRLPNEWTNADRQFFLEKLSEDFQDGTYVELLEDFVPRYHLIAPADQITFEKRLVEQWADNFYEYDAENRLATPTELIWPLLKMDTKAALIPFFIQIILSDRRTRYPQYQLARQIVQAEHANPKLQLAIESTFDSIIRQGAKVWIGSGWPDVADRAKVVNFLADANRAISPYVNNYTQRIEEIVEIEQAAAAVRR